MTADASRHDATRSDAGRPDVRGHRLPADELESAPLRATVVRYEHSPDRCTVSPADVDDADRLTTWLSVDASVVRTLDEMR